jgi:hypothetical protein
MEVCVRHPVAIISFAASTLGVSHSFAQPVNDACSTATPVAGFATVAWDTTGAATDGDADINCLPRTDGQVYRDVWFLWTPPASGPMTISTCGLTTMHTRMSVFAGPACPAASPIVCDDNSCGGQSSVSFSASANSTYLVRLGSSQNDDTGSGMLRFASGMVAGPIAGPLGASNYYLAQASSWDQAEAMGVSLGGHLVTISDGAENSFVRDSVLGFDSQPRRAWIGLHSPLHDGVYSWSSGDASSYRNWIPGEPNNLGGIEYTVEMVNSQGFTGEWNDAPSTHPPTRFAILEVPAVALCPADLDDNGVFEDGGTRDGAITIDDLLFFLAGFEAGNVAVDLDNDGDPALGTPDGAVTIDDLLFFLAHFELGC